MPEGIRTLGRWGGRSALPFSLRGLALGVTARSRTQDWGTAVPKSDYLRDYTPLSWLV